MPSPAPTLVEAFHAATCYAPATLDRLPPPDPAAQPPTFKTWHQARPRALPPGAIASGEPAEQARLDPGSLSRLLCHAYGVTALGRAPGAPPLFFRAAPSAGGLYPAELYAAVRGVEGVPDGLHAYLPREHALASCWEGDFHDQLVRYGFGHPALEEADVVLLASAVFGRSAWRYGDRAWRRVLLDTGHVLGNIVLAAPFEGLHAVPVADFADDAVDGLLLLDPGQEATLALVPLVPAPAPPAPWREAGRSPARSHGALPALGEWIRPVHDATRMDERLEPRRAPRAPLPQPLHAPIALESTPLEGGAPLLEAMRARRSTRRLVRGALPLGDVGRMLAAAWPPPGSPDPTAAIAPALLDTWVVVQAVDGLAPGTYRYLPGEHALAQVAGHADREALRHACLGQELGGDCALAVVHAFDLPAAVASHGERAYRYAHLEAGMLGARLQLAALRLGHGASGIAGFFDDDLARLLDLEPGVHAIAYLSVVGRVGRR
ncbi:MAG: SagB/ThcOx family dehydrogenase [Planctomycetia bacterium]